jgi:dihydroneopterin aldolase
VSDKITIKGIKAHGKHGVFEHEKIDGQDFVVDATLKVDLKEAAHSDDLSKSVNYDEVSVLIHETIQGPSVNLIETLAERIGDAILNKFKSVKEVEVTVHKPSAPVSVPFGDVAVTLKFER